MNRLYRFLWGEAGDGDKLLAVFAMLISITAFVYTIGNNRGWWEPIPYKNVTLVEAFREEDGLHLIAVYDKTPAKCTLERLVVFGYLLREVQPLDFIPVRDGNVSQQRTEGKQRMELVIDEKATQYDEIEVRTRHNCEGLIVDKSMLKVDVP